MGAELNLTSELLVGQLNVITTLILRYLCRRLKIYVDVGSIMTATLYQPFKVMLFASSDICQTCA